MPNLPMEENFYYSPPQRGWDHRFKCMTREAAEASRDAFKARLGTRIDGRRVKWKVRPCPICHKFYVDRDMSSDGDRRGQRQRQRARQRQREQAAVSA